MRSTVRCAAALDRFGSGCEENEMIWGLFIGFFIGFVTAALLILAGDCDATSRPSE